jgi:uncharacterized tellurite resistance protein B-like protein
MWKSFLDWLDAVIPPDHRRSADDAHAVDVAAAVMLVEVLRAEPGLRAEERRVAIDALSDQFGLSGDELVQLMALAERTAETAIDYFTFSSRINAAFDEARKIQLIEQMWRVAYADGRIGGEENLVLRKFADLLYIHPGAYANAKMRAKAAAQAG